MSFSYCAVFMTEECQLTGIELARQLGMVEPSVQPRDEWLEISDVREDELAVAKLGRWQVLFGQAAPFLEFDLSERCQQICRSGQLFFCLAQGTSGGLWFELYEKGDLVRKWVQVEGHIAEDKGEPLSCERMLSIDEDDGSPIEKDVWFLINLAECVTEVSWQDMIGNVVSSRLPASMGSDSIDN